jgi:hypothetical protein
MLADIPLISSNWGINPNRELVQALADLGVAYKVA